MNECARGMVIAQLCKNVKLSTNVFNECTNSSDYNLQIILHQHSQFDCYTSRKQKRRMAGRQNASSASNTHVDKRLNSMTNCTFSSEKTQKLVNF